MGLKNIINVIKENFFYGSHDKENWEKKTLKRFKRNDSGSLDPLGETKKQDYRENLRLEKERRMMKMREDWERRASLKDEGKKYYLLISNVSNDCNVNIINSQKRYIFIEK